jgi:hypothetical protein
MIRQESQWQRVKRPLAASLAALCLLSACAGQMTANPGTPAGASPTPYADPTPDPGYDPDPYPTAEPSYEPTPPPNAPDLGFDPRTLINPYDPNTGWGGVPREDLDNFQIVDDAVFRGGRPSRQGMMLLKKLGIKTIVTLEKDDSVVAAEQSLGQELGMKVINIPMGVLLPPSRSKVDQFLNLAGSPGEWPLYFHCKQGRDRTGAMALAYRVRIQHWQPEYAYSEMFKHGFHSGLLLLKRWAKKYAQGSYTPGQYPPVIPPDIPPTPPEDPNPQDPPPGTDT